jgi:uncharacterized membrane protein YjfL (UPF0719 family)
MDGSSGLKGLIKKDKSFIIVVIGIIFLIIGAVLYTIKADYEKDTESNKKTGKIMMSVGGGLIGLVILYIIYVKYKNN